MFTSTACRDLLSLVAELQLLDAVAQPKQMKQLRLLHPLGLLLCITRACSSCCSLQQPSTLVLRVQRKSYEKVVIGIEKECTRFTFNPL